jgi:hypothetical protein
MLAEVDVTLRSTASVWLLPMDVDAMFADQLDSVQTTLASLREADAVTTTGGPGSASTSR